MPEDTEETETVERNESETTSEDRKNAFDLGTGDNGNVNDLAEDLQEFGGDEGVEVERDQLQDVDPDQPLDDLAKRGATSDSDRDLSPSEEAESGDSESEPSEPESEEAETADVSTDIDPDVLEFVEENQEKVQNLQEWETKLTQRSQALSDVERLAKVREIASKDPGRAEKLREVIQNMQEGKYDVDNEVEFEQPELPDSIKGTENEEFFEQLVEQNQQLAEEANRMKKALKQQKTAQTQQREQGSDELVGDDQATPATEVPDDVLDEEVQAYESFIEEHPELTTENGEPTPELEEIQQVMNQTGGVLDWEQAYYSVLGEEVRESAKQSAEREEQLKENNSQTGTPTSELAGSTSNGSSGTDQAEQNRYDQLISSKGRRDQLARQLEQNS